MPGLAATDSSSPPADGLPPDQRLPAMLTVLGGIAMTVLDSTMVTLALPGIVRDLAITEPDAVWVLNAYQLAILALLLPLAKAGDLIGYRRIYLGGLGVFIVGSVGCLLAGSATQLLVARALAGAGSAGLFAVNAALVRRIYPVRLLGRGIAYNSAVVGVASVAGPALAAAVLSWRPWPWLFALNLPVALAVLALGWRSLPRTAAAADATPDSGAAAPSRERLPWADALLNALMFLGLFLGLQRLVPHGATPAQPGVALALVAGAVVVGIWHVRRQRRRSAPLLPVDLLAIPVFRLSMVTSVASFAAHTLAAVALPFLLFDALGRSPAQAGLVLAAWPLATVASAAVAGRLIGRVHNGLLGGVGLGLMAAGLGLLALLPNAAATDMALAWRLALCGIGFGLFQSPNNHTIVTSAPPHRSGGAAGMLGTARLTGQSLGALVVGALYGASGAFGGLASDVPHLALGVAAGLGALGAVTSLRRMAAGPIKPPSGPASG